MGNVDLLLYLCRVKREKEHREIFRCQWDTNGNITGLNSHATTNAALVAKQAVVDFYTPDSIPPGQFYNFRTLPAHWSSRHTTYWQHSDHLGSASWVTDTAGHGYEHFQYNAWGGPFITQRITGGDYQSRYTFSGKERDEETGFSYFGSRYYNSNLSIWLSVDPMSDKYPSLSPYVYCANNPVRVIDPSGDSCAVLLAGNSVGGMGHAALLIQGKDNRWYLYSKNGDDKSSSGSSSGTGDDIGYAGKDNKGWGSVKEFLNSHQENTVNHDGEGGTYYTEAYVLPTTAKQDDMIRNQMKQKLGEQYHFTSNNCIQAVVSALNSANVKTKSDSQEPQFTKLGQIVVQSDPVYMFAKHMSNTAIPITIYNEIKKANPQGKTIKPSKPW